MWIDGPLIAGSLQPKDHNSIKASEFRPVERELVFDIDLSDYDDVTDMPAAQSALVTLSLQVRTSGSGASISRRCWLYMVAAIKVMDVALRGRPSPHPQIPAHRRKLTCAVAQRISDLSIFCGYTRDVVVFTAGLRILGPADSTMQLAVQSVVTSM